MGSFNRYSNDIFVPDGSEMGTRLWWVDSDGRFIPGTMIPDDRAARRRAF